MALIARTMRGFGSKMNTYAQLESRISNISQQSTNLSHFNASPHPAKFSVSYASYRRYFSAKDDRTKCVRPLCEAILYYFETNPAGLEEVLTKMLIELTQEEGISPRMKLNCSIRRKILELETQLAPELEDPKTVVDDPDDLPIPYKYYWLYTQEKWSMILQKKDDPRVQKLLELIEKAEISQDVFRQSLGHFSLTPSKDNRSYTCPLTEFDVDEIETLLQCRFGKKHPHIIFDMKSITHVLMKIE